MYFDYNETNVILFADYKAGYPKLVQLCIDRAKTIADNVYIIGEDLSANLFKEYVSDKLKLNINEIKLNNYADYLTYYPLESLYDVYGIELNKVMKIDTDYYITSKFILKDLFEINKCFIGVDSNFRPHYGGTIPGVFRNCFCSYETNESRISQYVSKDEFRDSVIDCVRNKHYTASGPTLANKLKLPTLDSFVPWSSDPSQWIGGEGEYTEVPPHGALGFHFQESFISDSGFKLVNCNCISNKLMYELIRR